jgi:hypothetical protein
MAKKATKKRKAAGKKKAAKRTPSTRRIRAGDEISTSVLDGAMKGAIRSAFLNRA